ncbi:3-deoxy-manno-octulosonate cytidylyltransferase [Bacteroidota bacterium]
MTKIVGIIPSRYQSTRFPGKPLIDIAGKSMIQRVYEQASKSTALAEVIVATDDQRISDHVKSFGGQVLMTSSDHLSGTDRCAEVVSNMSGIDVVINIQGDEPFVNPEQINQLAAKFDNPKTQIATLIKRIENNADLFSDTVIKVAKAANDNALYFSRSTIPFQKGVPPVEWLSYSIFYKHIGVYAYRTETLKKVSKLAPSSLEMQEGLEQLRWMENGFEIQLTETEHESNSVDTPEDLQRLLEGF